MVEETQVLAKHLVLASRESSQVLAHMSAKRVIWDQVRCTRRRAGSIYESRGGRDRGHPAWHATRLRSMARLSVRLPVGKGALRVHPGIPRLVVRPESTHRQSATSGLGRDFPRCGHYTWRRNVVYRLAQDNPVTMILTRTHGQPDRFRRHRGRAEARSFVQQLPGISGAGSSGGGGDSEVVQRSPHMWAGDERALRSVGRLRLQLRLGLSPRAAPRATVDRWALDSRPAAYRRRIPRNTARPPYKPHP